MKIVSDYFIDRGITIFFTEVSMGLVYRNQLLSLEFFLSKVVSLNLLDFNVINVINVVTWNPTLFSVVI